MSYSITSVDDQLELGWLRHSACRTRTTNLIERLFGEERRRLKIVPNAFGEKPVLP
jgi:hypothetical protein